MTSIAPRPLITFVVMTHNQEAFVREALLSALGQTYSPLEILVSDDGSTDRTFEVMQEILQSYQGPHQIRVNRPPKNMGTCAHCNQVMELARGELVIIAAGDDISLPERTQIFYEAWENTGRKAGTIYSAYVPIDRDGNEVNYQPQERRKEAQRFVVETIDPYEFVRGANPQGARLHAGLDS